MKSILSVLCQFGYKLLRYGSGCLATGHKTEVCYLPWEHEAQGSTGDGHSL